MTNYGTAVDEHVLKSHNSLGCSPDANCPGRNLAVGRVEAHGEHFVHSDRSQFLTYADSAAL
jgi:hypothetical protein